LLFAQGRLFADASLQVLFILLSARGWWLWARYGETEGLPITVAPKSMIMRAMGASVILSVVIAVVLWFVRGSVPVFDGLITGLSVVAQWLLNRKIVQTWYWWIAVDVISIPVYAYKGLYLIALLYAVFLSICIVGLKRWLTELTDNSDPINMATNQLA